MFVHSVSGQTFTAERVSEVYGAAAVDGRWESGQAGTIWPNETFKDGSRIWNLA